MRVVRKNIVIDGNWLFYVIYYRVKKNLGSDRVEKPHHSYFINTFITYILDLLRLIPHHTIVFVFDSGLPSWRKKLYKGYKANREGSLDEVERLIKQLLLEKLQKVLAKRFQVIVKDHIEGDDLIYAVKLKLKHTATKLVIHTKDRDMLQLIDYKTEVYDGGNYYTLHNTDPMFSKFEKVLLGDSSDNIKRVLKKGIGPKKISAIYTIYGSDIDFIENKVSLERLKGISSDKNISIKKLSQNAQLILLDKKYFPKYIWSQLESIRIDKSKDTQNLSLKDFEVFNKE